MLVLSCGLETGSLGVLQTADYALAFRGKQMSHAGGNVDVYRVVVNHEEQYSIWPADRESPIGWRDAGMSGTKDACLACINEVWADMRPLSLRKIMDETISEL